MTPGKAWRARQATCVCCGERATTAIGGQDSDGHVWHHAVCVDCREAIIDEHGQPQAGGASCE